MTGWNRAVSTLLGAGVAGFLLWIAAQIGRGSTGGYWAAYGIVAGAGLVLALSQLRGAGGNPAGMFLFAFLPVLICAGWVLLAMQPHSNWIRDHLLVWSGHVGIRDVVRDVGTWLGVLAFGIGFVFGAMLEPGFVRRRRAETIAPATATAAPAAAYRLPADEPTMADRTELARERAAERDGVTTSQEPTAR
ncbi:MAG TPA: hypothetical protein VFA19_13655 [Gaiellaceae bacterium]|nr:hypothetical protein [Gaiellaceae bacterium]HZU20436.1 hypothetical protein [Gaiellaceae bacterium]